MLIGQTAADIRRTTITRRRTAAVRAALRRYDIHAHRHLAQQLRLRVQMLLQLALIVHGEPVLVVQDGGLQERPHGQRCAAQVVPRPMDFAAGTLVRMVCVVVVMMVVGIVRTVRRMEMGGGCGCCRSSRRSSGGTVIETALVVTVVVQMPAGVQTVRMRIGGGCGGAGVQMLVKRVQLTGGEVVVMVVRVCIRNAGLAERLQLLMVVELLLELLVLVL